MATIWRWDNQRDQMPRCYMANLRLQIPTDTTVIRTFGYIKNNPAPRYLSAGIICSKRRTFSPRTRLEKYYAKKLRGKDNILGQIYICYLPGGRSVWEKTVPEVLSTARGRRPRAVLKTKGTFFSNTDRPSPVNDMFIFFCSKYVLQITNGLRNSCR